MSDEEQWRYRFVWPTFDRGGDAFQAFLLWGGATFLGGAWVAQLLLPAWKPPERFPLFGSAALVVALFVPAKRWLFRYHTVDVGPGQIEFTRAVGSTFVPVGDVVGLVAQSGLNWNRLSEIGDEGQRLVSWQKLVVLTEGERYVLPFEAAVCRVIYEAMQSVCPAAWGVPYPGNLEPPQGDTSAASPLDRVAGLQRVRRFYRFQAAKNATVGFALVIGAVATVVAMVVGVFLEKLDELNANMIIFMTLFTVAGGMFLKDLPRDVRVLTQLRREAAKLRN
jgi:hypothetical protein